jgi:hypothetical protein
MFWISGYGVPECTTLYSDNVRASYKRNKAEDQKFMPKITIVNLWRHLGLTQIDCMADGAMVTVYMGISQCTDAFFSW